MNDKPTRWSYSSLSTYENCPRQWYYSYIENLPYPESAAMIRGSRLHSFCEDFLNDKLNMIPWDLRKVARKLDEMKWNKAKSEQVWTLNQEWEAKKPTWIKCIIDVHWMDKDVLQIRDFKSGREYPDHRDQLELYAVVGLQIYPDAKRAEFAATYLDTGHESNEGAILRGDMADSKRKSWGERAIKIFEDTEYKKNPGRRCDWCSYRDTNGGPCDARE